MSPRPRVDHAARLRRMLGMLPWLIAEGTTTVGEVAARFGVSEKQVFDDLTVLSMARAGPNPEDALSLYVDDDGTVEVWERSLFTRPLRLTEREAFAVLAAGRALLALPDPDIAPALATALDKLELALGGEDAVAVKLPAPRYLALVQDAAERHERLEITYYTLSRDVISARRIEPLVVYSDEGQWHVLARDDVSRDHRRRFRVDRILAAARTGEMFEPEEVEVPATAFVPVAGTRQATLELPPSARWVPETYDALEVEDLEGGRLRVVLRVTGEVWLAQLLVRLGPEARVVAPHELANVGREAAARLLARYE